MGPAMSSGNSFNKPRPVDLAHESAFALGNAEIRPATREVIASNGRDVLEPKVMQVLVVLYHGRGEVVSRDELIARCWGGRVVGDDAINRCIARIRRLSETHGGFLLETIARVGHRLIISEEAVPDAPPVPHLQGVWRRLAAWVMPWRFPLLFLAVLMMVAGLAYWHIRSEQTQTVVVQGPVRLSIAVLPFTPLYSDGEAQNLGDSIASAIADLLSSGTRFEIIAPAKSFAFRGAAKAKAVQSLHADFIIDGELRRTPSAITAAIRLIDGRTGDVLRTQTINRAPEEAGRLPDHVATTVANFGWVAAFGFGSHVHWNQHAMAVHLQVVDKVVLGDAAAAYEMAQRLAQEFPGDAFAMHEPSVAIYYLLGSASPEKKLALAQEAQAYVKKAIALDPGYGEPYIQLQSTSPGLTLAERETILRKALALSPESVYGRSALVEILQNAGYFREAEPIAEDGLARAPYHEGLYMRVINSRVWTGRAGEAHSLIERGIDVFPRKGGYFAKMFEAAAFNGDVAGAAKLLTAPALKQAYFPDTPPALYGIVIDALNHRRPATDVVKACEPVETRGYEIRQTCVVALAALKQLDAAFRVAAVLYPDIGGASAAERTRKWASVRYFPASYLFIPATAPMRADPRFSAVVERLGLTGYWKARGRLPDFCASEKALVCAALSAK